MSVLDWSNQFLTGPGVGRGEEVEVLAAGVEDRLAGLGEAVGQRDTICPARAHRARSSETRLGW